MKIPISLLITFCICAHAQQAEAQRVGQPVPGRFIVLVKNGSSPRVTANANGVVPEAVFTTATNGFAGVIGARQLARLAADPLVLEIIPDRIVSANPRGGNGGGKPDKPSDGEEDPPEQRDPEVVPSGVNSIGAAPGMLAFTGAGVGVAVVDTGIDMSHPDLTVGFPSFKAVAKGFRITTRESADAGDDDEGHGTHVAGIIAAKRDGFDVVGVAPDVTLYAVKVLDKNGRGLDSTVIAGLDWIARNANFVNPKIKVVNMSLGRSGTIDDNTVYRDAIQALYGMGITIVTSAGNDCDLEITAQIPAAYTEVLATASVTAEDGDTDGSAGELFVARDTASFFTTDGSDVTISAPGEKREDIVAGYLNSVGILSTRLGGGTTRLSGTSMASPHVAGIAALLVEQSLGGINPEEVRLSIMSSAVGIGAIPLGSPTECYTYDDQREGVLTAPNSLAASP